MNYRAILTVYLKELRDSLRDRRTIISMFVIPTLVIPLVIMGFGAFTTKIVRKARAETPAIMVLGAERSPLIQAALSAHPRFKLVPAKAEFREEISEKRIRAAIEIPDDFDRDLSEGNPSTIKVYTYDGEMRSGFAAGEIERFLRDYREKTIQKRLGERGLSEALLKPFEVSRQNVAPPEKVGGNLIGGVIPYVIILLSFTGAMYPAMDLTAGEKERGTMETLLCSPIGRTEIVLGKFFVVLTAALATVVLSSLASMVTLSLGASLFIGKPSVQAAAAAGATRSALPTIDPVGFFTSLTMVLPIAILFSAVLLTLSLFAKSYKEAQSYVSPLIILVILPAMVALFPGVELNLPLAMVPILNVSLLCKDLVSGVFNWTYIVLIFSSTCLYAGIALALAVKMFNRESVLFRS